MSEEKGPVRGQEGHWRYRKDKSAGNKFDNKGLLISTGPPDEGTTDTETTGLQTQSRPSTPDPNGVYTEEVAKGFNKKEQRNLLKARKIMFKSRTKEKDLIDLIIQSNPTENTGGEDATEDEDVPPESGVIAKFTGAQLEDFKAKKLVEILKGLGVKKIPLSEKGKIKKILETQQV